MLSSRELNIIHDIINTPESLTIYTLSKKYNISERMVRYDMDKINDFLKKQKLPLIDLKNNNIQYFSPKELKKYFDNTRVQCEFTTEERSIVLILTVLFEPRMTRTLFCKRHGITKMMLYTSIKHTKEFLAHFFLNFSSVPLQITGSEENIRHLLLYCSQKYTIFHQDSFFVKTLRTFLFLDQYTIDIRELLTQISQKINKVFADDSLLLITNYCKISLKRISMGNELTHITNVEFLKITPEYTIIQNTLDSMKIQEFSLEFEILKLADLIIGAKSQNLYTSFYDLWACQADQKANNTYISPLYDLWIHPHNLVNNIIRSISEKLNNALIINDPLLYESLFNHIKPTIYRLFNKKINNTTLHDSAYDEVMCFFPEIYEVVEDQLQQIAKVYPIQFTPTEIAFISIHFKASIDRNKHQQLRKKIIIVCHSGFGTSMLISQQITERYKVDILKLCPVHQLSETLKGIPDAELIITTLDIEEQVIPVVKVGLLLSLDDIKALNDEGLEQVSLNKYKLSDLVDLYKDPQEITARLREFFKDNLIDDLTTKTKTNDMFQATFVKKTSVTSWEQAVRISAEILEEAGYINCNYTEDMVKNMEKYSSYLITSSGMAIPHAISNGNVFKTGFSLLILENPVIFPEGETVSIILTIASHDQTTHKEYFSALFKILSDSTCQNEIKLLMEEEIHHYLITNM